MTTRTLASLAITLLCIGCDGGLDRGIEGDEPHVRAYLIASMEEPEPSGPSLPGFDIDGVVSDGFGDDCRELTPDFSHEGRTGIDSSMNILSSSYSAFVGSSPSTELARALRESRLGVVIELRGITARRDGPVTVALLAVSATSEIHFGADGRASDWPPRSSRSQAARS